MRAREILREDLDEGIRDTLAAAGVSAALALGGHALYKNSTQRPQSPVVTGVVQPAPEPETAPETETAPELTLEGRLEAAAIEAGITGTELAHFMSQAAHETMNFARMVETGSSTYFNRYDPDHNPRNAKILGNTKAGDGERYKGRGYFQVTGRWNYARIGKALGLPLEDNPEMLADPDVAAKAAVWFWTHRVKVRVPNLGSVRDVTKPINAGLKGMASREAKYAHYLKKYTGQTAAAAGPSGPNA